MGLTNVKQWLESLQVVSEDRRLRIKVRVWWPLSSTPAACCQSLLVQLMGALEIAEVFRGL